MCHCKWPTDRVKMDAYSTKSAQTTQTTNTSDSSYPILFQLQSTADKATVAQNNGLSSPYTRRKSHVHAHTLKRVRIALALLGILGIVMVIFVLSFYLPEGQKIGEKDVNYRLGNVSHGSLLFNIRTAGILLHNFITNTSLRIQTKLSNTASATLKVISHSHTNIVLKTDSAVFRISSQSRDKQSMCWNISISRIKPGNIGKCVEFGNGKWYGIGERYFQTWLLNDANISMVPFNTFDIAQGKVNKSYGGVIEPYIFSSLGFGIKVDRTKPLSLSVNNPDKGKLCILLPSDDDRSSRNNGNTVDLHYTVCMSKNVREVHKYMLEKFFSKPLQTPDTRMLTSPVWSTWAKYKKNITQEKVLQFARDIVNHSMPISQLEIDDKYSTHYGDFDFDPAKFDDPIKMIKDLHSMGMRVTVWVYPFANLNSKALNDGASFWVKSGRSPGIVLWWNGLGAVLDTTNTEGVSWFKNRLKTFMNQFGVDGLKFDAGEVRYLPVSYKFYQPLENINFFSSKYVEMASTFGGLGEVRVGYGNQNSSLFTRILDRSSTWGIDNGLKSVVTSTLTFGILGYPFVLPDMVGGNAYIGKPDQELYIRWIQLNTFLPSIQFSIAPWDYNPETVNLTKAALAVRDIIAQDILKFAKIAASTGYPIVRPLWWQAPNDTVALTEDSEFLIGDKYLIAPVLEKGAQERTVYLIEGLWQEMFGNKKVFNVSSEGRRILYKVGLEDIIYFKNLNSEE